LILKIKNVINTQMYVVIDGNIGVGKSTVIHTVQDKLRATHQCEIIPEPVDKWVKSGILQLFYSDPKQYAYLFQTSVVVDRFNATPSILKMTSPLHPSPNLYIGERTINSDRLFVNVLHSQGQFSDLEFNIYNEWQAHFESLLRKPQLYIFLECSPEISLERIQKRSRDGESNISLDYLYQLKNEYEKFKCDNEVRIDVSTLTADEVTHKICDLITTMYN